jgi:hypothetical protein
MHASLLGTWEEGIYRWPSGREDRTPLFFGIICNMLVFTIAVSLCLDNSQRRQGDAPSTAIATCCHAEAITNEHSASDQPFSSMRHNRILRYSSPQAEVAWPGLPRGGPSEDWKERTGSRSANPAKVLGMGLPPDSVYILEPQPCF